MFCTKKKKKREGDKLCLNSKASCPHRHFRSCPQAPPVAVQTGHVTVLPWASDSLIGTHASRGAPCNTRKEQAWHPHIKEQSNPPRSPDATAPVDPALGDLPVTVRPALCSAPQVPVLSPAESVRPRFPFFFFLLGLLW